MIYDPTADSCVVGIIQRFDGCLGRIFLAGHFDLEFFAAYCASHVAQANAGSECMPVSARGNVPDDCVLSPDRLVLARHWHLRCQSALLDYRVPTAS